MTYYVASTLRIEPLRIITKLFQVIVDDNIQETSVYYRAYDTCGGCTQADYCAVEYTGSQIIRL